MTKERRDLIMTRADMVLRVLSQVPMMENPKARAAGNIVWQYCKDATCKTDEERELWDGAFGLMMPLNDADEDEYLIGIGAKDRKPGGEA